MSSTKYDPYIKSHASTVLPECCKDDIESQWKSLKFDPRHPKTPEPMATKIGRGDYARISTPEQNCITIRLGVFPLPHICEVAYQMFTRLVSAIKPRRSHSAAAYIVVKLSRGRSVVPYVRAWVGRSVCLSSALWRNSGSDPDAVWHRRSDGYRDEAGRAVWGSVHWKGYFGGEFGARHCNQWGLYGVDVQQRREAALFPNYFGQTCFWGSSNSLPPRPLRRFWRSIR